MGMRDCKYGNEGGYMHRTRLKLTERMTLYLKLGKVWLHFSQVYWPS